VAAGNALLLIYGGLRPESLEFSIPFLIAPSLGGLAATGTVEKRLVAWLVAGVIVGLVVVLLLTELVLR
jgi:hypothetical protein